METSILSFGAVADGKTLNTQAIQKAIDTVAENGGGRVTIPSGTFLSGTIWLKSHIELHLESGAVLKASENLDDYNAEDAYVQNYGWLPEGWIGKHFILAIEQTDISVTGNGIIDASGENFFGDPVRDFYTNFSFRYGIAFSKEGEVRPGQTMCIVECTDVTIRDVSIINSPSWCFFLHGSLNVTVSGIKVKNKPFHANTDGIDIDSCRNVTVSNCIIETGDDAIAIRCAGYRLRNKATLCENITVTNCVFTAHSSGVRISVGRGKIENVVLSNLVIKKASPAINVATAYLGSGSVCVENLLISNIIADDVGVPLSIRENNNCYVKSVIISNFIARAMCNLKIIADEAGSVSDITLRDVRLNIKKPEHEVMGNYLDDVGTHAILLNGVNGMYLDNVKVNISPDVDLKLYNEDNSENVIKQNCNF